jgi:uncharacterized membrane protein
MQSVPDEKTALSGMPVVPTVVNGSGSSQPLGTPAEPVVTGAPAREPLLACPGDFRAALLVVTPAVPLFATIAAVGIYVIPQSVVLAPFLDWVKPNALIAGVVVAVVGALFLAAIHCWVANGTAADHANSSAYSELVARFREIEARLGVVGERTNLSPSEQIAYRQVQSLSHMIHKELGTPGARWVLATGYVNLWGLVHRAEEALLLVEPVEDVLRAAIYDELRLQSSAIENSADLLMKLRLAVSRLQPEASGYFAQQAGTGAQGPASGGPSLATASAARAALAQVRQSINEFRDGNWGALARTRNHLLGTITATGSTTFLLLALAIAVSPRIGPVDPFSDAIVAAASFYLVGAIVGLFNRLYNESASDNSVEDFGLTMARLGLTPILAGMAALGGVLIVAMLPAVMSNGVSLASSASATRVVTSLPLPALADIYSLTNNPFGVIFAAIFGLSPMLLLSSLQDATDKYRASIKSTAPATDSH